MPVKSVFFHLTRFWLNVGRRVVLLVLLAAVLWAYAQALLRQLPTSDELRHLHAMEERHLTMAVEAKKDQMLDFSRGVSEPLNNWLPHRTDGLVRPLWPWLAAWLMDGAEGKESAPGISQRFAQRVHWLNLSFSLGVLLLLGLACARAFSVPAALLSIFLVGFGVFLPASRHFLPDLLFSVLFLITWMSCIAALKRNSLWLYGIIGFFSALTNLTAPTAMPLVLAFVLVSTLRWAWGWLVSQGTHGGTTLWVRRNHWLGLMLLAVCHFFTTGPMLAHAHQKFGDAMPFHWRWFDSAEEMRAWTATHQSRESLRAVPVDQRPSFDNYRSTHTPEEMRDRWQSGAEMLLKKVLPFDWAAGWCPRGSFAVALACLLGVLVLILMFVAPRAHHAGQALHPESAPIVLFSVLALTVCTLDFGWDMRVLDFGNRGLALYAPLVLSLIWACEALVQRVRRRQMRLPVFYLYQAMLWLLCAAAAWWGIAFLRSASSTA